MSRNVKIALISLAVFVVIYFLIPTPIALKFYDAYVDALPILGAIIVAGLYWFWQK